MKQKYRGFTFIELLVVIVVTVLLFVFIFPIHFDRRYMEIAKRVQCSANLHDLGIVFTIYQNDNRGMNPIVGQTDHPKAYFGAGLYNTNNLLATNTRFYQQNFDWDNHPTTVGGSLYLLVKHADVNPKLFICPSDDEAQDINLEIAISKNPAIEAFEDLNDFQTMLNLSYSYNDPFNNPLDDSADASLALLADANPNFDTPTGAPVPGFGCKPNPGDNANVCDKNFMGNWTAKSELTGHVTGNSRNHQHEMQNVLFADGHVKQHQTPRAGIDRDNIYTYWSGDPDSSCLHKAIGRWDTFTKQFKSSSGAQDKTDSYLGN